MDMDHDILLQIDLNSMMMMTNDLLMFYDDDDLRNPLMSFFFQLNSYL